MKRGAQSSSGMRTTKLRDVARSSPRRRTTAGRTPGRPAFWLSGEKPMTDPTSTVRGISDTARWVRVFSSAGNLNDPTRSFGILYAEVSRLAGAHGFQRSRTRCPYG